MGLSLSGRLNDPGGGVYQVMMLISALNTVWGCFTPASEFQVGLNSTTKDPSWIDRFGKFLNHQASL